MLWVIQVSADRWGQSVRPHQRVGGLAKDKVSVDNLKKFNAEAWISQKMCKNGTVSVQ